MSVRFPNPSDYFYRGDPWTGAAYPAPVAQPSLANMAMCGLAFRAVAGPSGYEPIWAASIRFGAGAGSYHFTGWTSSGFFYPDPQSGALVHTPVSEPTNGTWFQWAFTQNAGVFTHYWKALGAVTWNSVSTPMASVFTPARMFFGADEYGDAAPYLTLSNVRCWSGGTAGAMTGADLMTEVDSTSLIRVANVFGWYKMIVEGDLGHDSSGQDHPLTISGTPILGTASPLEAPPDVAAGGSAVGSAPVRRWVSAGSANAIVLAIGAATTRGWKSSGSATVIATALGSARSRGWVASSTAEARAIASGIAKAQRWRGSGLALVSGEPTPPEEPPLPSDVDVFTRIRGRAANVIALYGADVFFESDGEAAHQAEDGSWVEASDGADYDAKGIQTRGDPDELGLIGMGTMVLKNPVVVLVAAVKETSPGSGVFTPIEGEPTPGQRMRWSNIVYGVVRTLPVAPNGKPIYYVVMGDT